MYSLWSANRASQKALASEALRREEETKGRQAAVDATRRQQELYTQAQEALGTAKEQRAAAEQQRAEAVRQRNVAEAVTKVSLAQEWLGQTDQGKIRNAAETLTALLGDSTAPAEGRLRAAEELRNVPLGALPRELFNGIASTLRGAAEKDADPKIKDAALRVLSVLNQQFEGQWDNVDPSAPDQAIASLTIERREQSIRIRGRGRCGQAECQLDSGDLAAPVGTLAESYGWKAGGFAFTLSRGRTRSELTARSIKLSPDGSPGGDV
jgi:hypothetical protein